ncbi:EAL and GGDEF domain-containing protein [Parasalinivibrio latis]|uniref:GGDEF domain-containing protein n=1 Tax=Parasalinivibrio latis TaxID=2952610 RepID=UPI0030E00EA4
MQLTIEDIIRERHVVSYFQQIADIQHNQIIGYEALARGPMNHPLQTPLNLFSEAKHQGLSAELDICCLENALSEAAENQCPGLIFLNIAPETLMSVVGVTNILQKLVERYNIPPEKLVIELSEQHQYQDVNLIVERAELIKEAGFQIALDDLGSGSSGLKVWAGVKPNFVKIDRFFVQDIHIEPVKREFVQSIVDLARNTLSEVIAEGIEKPEELRQLQRMGVKFGQGYLLGIPDRIDNQYLSGLLTTESQPARRQHSISIGTLARSANPVDVGVRVEQVYERFLADTNLLSIPVTDKGIPVGLARRAKVMEIFSRVYGRALYAAESIGEAMDRDAVVVDWQQPLEKVSALVTSRSDQTSQQQHFIVTQDQQYYGLVSVHSLLHTITEYRLMHARYANPLTLLPGNVPIYKAIDKHLSSRQDFYVAYFDLNNFKPYNDVYGYAEGDKVIQWVGALLDSLLTPHGHFLGHVGGDDFVAVFSCNSDWRQLCHSILDKFRTGIAQFYNEEHRQAGGIHAKSRTGSLEFYPLLGIAIGVINPIHSNCHSHNDVASEASKAKHRAKASGDGHSVQYYHSDELDISTVC